jgi:hypothetical protein
VSALILSIISSLNGIKLKSIFQIQRDLLYLHWYIFVVIFSLVYYFFIYYDISAIYKIFLVISFHSVIYIYFLKNSKKTAIQTLTPIFLAHLSHAIVVIILRIIDFQDSSSIFDGEVNLNVKAVVLGLFGIEMNRVEYPFTGGFNNFAIYLGGITLFFLYLSIKHRKITPLLAALLSFAVVLTLDTRITIMLIIFLVLVFPLYRLIAQIPFIVIILVVIFGPLLLYLILPMMDGQAIVENMNRSQGDLESGNSRFFIWAISISKLTYFDVESVIGYGYQGHYTSGASKMWAFVFKNWINAEMKSPHSSILSCLFDYGVAGTVVYLSLLKQLWIKARHFVSKHGNWSFIAFILFYITAGFTETLSGLYNFNFFLLSTSIFMGILMHSK